MDTLTPAAPWVALLLAVVALLWCRALRRTAATDYIRLSEWVADVEQDVARRALKRPARKPTPLADSERLLAASSKAEGA